MLGRSEYRLRSVLTTKGGVMDTCAQIGPSIRIKGSVTAHEPLTIAGHVDGSIDVSGHRLTVTEAAQITADVLAHTVVVAGSMNGSISAEGRIVVEQTASIEGELSAPTVSVEEGARLHGRCEIAGKRAELQLAS
jgi:cytoskeletal protein CcmA (bactofilin family)